MRRGQRALAVVVPGALALALGMLSLGAGAQAAPLQGKMIALPAEPSLCGRVRDAHAAYGWPLKPFGGLHSIRGAFGDPRTVERSLQRVDGPWSTGSFAFHNGIDIVAPDGTAVYPAVSGVAYLRHRHEIVVDAAGWRTFQYWHVDPLVQDGQRVVADRTVLGVVQAGQHHLHFGEIDAMRVVNPLAAGHIGPYRDPRVPVVRRLIARSRSGRQLPLDRLRGVVALIADAFDPQPLPVPGVWSGMPVAPALVRWRLTRLDGSARSPHWRVAADFRQHEPSLTRFWQVYAPGTYQNFPVMDDHFDWDTPGRYLFRLTHPVLDTRTLPDGRYLLTVEASDVCGNRGVLE